MKSGPTLAPAGRCPARRSAARSPVATVVFPTPEWVPATTTRGPRNEPPSTPADVVEVMVRLNVARPGAGGYSVGRCGREAGANPARSRHCDRGADLERPLGASPGRRGER